MLLTFTTCLHRLNTQTIVAIYSNTHTHIVVILSNQSKPNTHILLSNAFFKSEKIHHDGPNGVRSSVACGLDIIDHNDLQVGLKTQNSSPPDFFWTLRV